MGHQSTASLADCATETPKPPCESTAPEKTLIGKAETKNNVTKTKPKIASLFILLPPLSYTYRSTTEIKVCLNNYHKKFFTAI
jgi:hypothetical protein